MIYTRTVIVRPSETDEDCKSIEENGVTFCLPCDLQERLDEEIQHIYKINRKGNILNMTITPKITYFQMEGTGIALPIPVRYDIVYVYKSDEI